VDHAIDVLERPRHLDERRAVQRHAEAAEHARGQDGIARAGLVLEREEAEALRRARPLAHDAVPGRAHVAAVGQLAQVGRAQHAAPRELRAEVAHHVRARGDAAAAVVGERALDGSHLRQR
jgi:hypothetical protein